MLVIELTAQPSQRARRRVGVRVMSRSCTCPPHAHTRTHAHTHAYLEVADGADELDVVAAAVDLYKDAHTE
jgi:deoxyribose-phosphate aldolase